MNRAVGLDPVPEEGEDSGPETQPGSHQGTPGPRNGPRRQDLIQFRLKELYNRRFILQKMQSFRKKKAHDVGGTEELSCEDSDQLCELEAIQKEVEELLIKKEQLEKQGHLSKLRANKGQQAASSQREAPRGGVYTLPPQQLMQEDQRPAAGEPADPVLPDGLRRTAAFTTCPLCEELVFTQTHSSAGETAGLVCLLCTMTGCVAGCCLLPFCMNPLKDVQHRCPRCQAHIHTHRPF